jgi:hypothetical protein
MYRWPTVVTILVVVLVAACGGDGDATPTPETVAGPAGVLEFTVTGDGLEPKQMDVEAGQTYRFRLLNETNRARILRAPRWGFSLTALAGETAESESFVPSVPDEYPCWEQSAAASPDFKCVIVVK